MPIHINDIARALGRDSFARDMIISDLMIDSRSVTRPESTLFVALKSPNNDGHRYITQLACRGVSNFVVETVPDSLAGNQDLNFIIVSDTLEALQKIGRFCRRQSAARFIAITGSRGKTTVKEMIFQALAGKCNVSRSPRSYNSQIGVPLSLWQTQGCDIAVIEAGISRKGEMEKLESIIKPEIGIITSITGEHDSGFCSKTEKICEKIRLFKDASTIIYNVDDPEISESVSALPGSKNLVGIHLGMDGDPQGNAKYAEALLGQLGYGSAYNEMAGRLRPVKTRLNVIEGVNNCKLIFDGFTNDTLSLRSALDFMNRRTPETLWRTLIISVSDYIGDTADIAFLMKEYSISRAIVIGRKGNWTEPLPGCRIEQFDDVAGMMSSVTANEFTDEMILLKGGCNDSLSPIYSMLEAKQHETVLEVNLDAIINNFNFFRSKVKRSTGVICMLKAHGYGAGSIELARTLQAQGAAYIAVAVVDEGIELRQAGISMPIMVLNPRAQNHKMMFDYRLEPEIYNFQMLEEIIENARRYGVTGFPVHIKLETGMRRLGFVEDEIEELGRRLSRSKEIKASTVFSHLACADDPAEDGYTQMQFDVFSRCCDRLDAILPAKPKRHILNSTGILRFPQWQYDFVRLGIGLYGIPTVFDGSESEIRNVSTLSSVIISIKRWPAGTTIGYNRRGILQRDSVIATVPIGYADGLDRHLGYGNSEMIVNGHRCRTVGSICMDICMIDVTDVECAVGDHVEIFGDTVSPMEFASALGTIPYEILTSISPRVKRVYYRE